MATGDTLAQILPRPASPQGCVRFALWRLGPCLRLGVGRHAEREKSILSVRCAPWVVAGTAFLIVDGLSLPRFVTIELGETQAEIDLLIGSDLRNLPH